MRTIKMIFGCAYGLLRELLIVPAVRSIKYYVVDALNIYLRDVDALIGKFN